MGLKEEIKKSISVPDYMMKFVDSTINLNENSKACCPFHGEKTPSFSYNEYKKVWRCFGACKTGGDVIHMHKHHYKLGTYEEAMKSLAKILGVKATPELTFDFHAEPDMEYVEYAGLYKKALLLCRTIDDWLAMDYIMGQFIRRDERKGQLESFINERNG